MRTYHAIQGLALKLLGLYHETYSKVKAVGATGVVVTALLMAASLLELPLEVGTAEVIGAGAVALVQTAAGWLKKENTWR